ncbi:uncharacterized protein LOC128995778 [Macrosteles quadrilineatus]|uniref:uncharacterized protein LOC128995778 n=1 Tax=Macrosteles quadrilineatus TaxID=74068 RepID=UPI0023E09B04|nr:uncharacterized protein LOC128995778 [Macrosteles quadrilineatus]
MTSFYSYPQDAEVHKLKEYRTYDEGDNKAMNDECPTENACLSVNINDEVQSNEDNTKVGICEDDSWFLETDTDSDEFKPVEAVDIQKEVETSHHDNNLNDIEKEINQNSFEEEDLNHDVTNNIVVEDTSFSYECGSQSMFNEQTMQVNITSELQDNSRFKLGKDINESVETDNTVQSDGRGDDHSDAGVKEVYRLDYLDCTDEKHETSNLNLPDNYSDSSSDCELGIRSFKIENFKYKSSNFEKPDPKENKRLFNNTLINNKISRYVSNTLLSQVPKRSDCEKKPAESGNTTVKDGSLKKKVSSKTFTVTENVFGAPNVFTDENDVYSNGSMNSRVGLELSHNAGFAVEFSEDNYPKEDRHECECAKSNCCLYVVEDDEVDLSLVESSRPLCSEAGTQVVKNEAIFEGLLTPQELDSVETNSESDWLYKVDTPNILQSTMAGDSEEEVIFTREHQADEMYSESSSEDFANRFYIQQWLMESEQYYNNRELNQIDCGDSI